jgi:hypothetical protein
VKKIKSYIEIRDKIEHTAKKVHEEMRSYVSSMSIHKEDFGIQLRFNMYDMNPKDEVALSIYNAQGVNIMFKVEQLNDLISCLQEFRSKINEER